MSTRVAAVDLGATSGRVALVDLDALSLEVVHRFANGPVRDTAGDLRWPWERIVGEVEAGLAAAIERGPVASIGIDTWGVDYGLLDARGELVAAPFSYRDRRTEDWRGLIESLGIERIYATTGIQMMALNTLCQLAFHDRSELAPARRLLMLPELVVYGLTGVATGERTSAGTSQLVDIATGDWSADLVEAIGVDPSILPPIVTAGSAAGHWRGVPVCLVGGHDTASAVAALPDPAPGSVFVSLGTWALVGAERPMPDTSEAARLANFSNEPAVFSGVRFLKNVMGLWMLEQCRAQWNANTRQDLQDMLEAAACLPEGGPTVDARDERFASSDDMEAEVRAASGLGAAAGRDHVVRCILDSLAAAIAGVVAETRTFLATPMPAVHVIGGGSRNRLLNRLIEQACGVPVKPGPAEATSLGNAMVQGIALGRFADLGSARKNLASSAAMLRNVTQG